MILQAFLRLVAGLFAASLVSGCMMLSMGGAMVGMDMGMEGHGADPAGHDGGAHSSGQGVGGHAGSLHGQTPLGITSDEHPLLERCGSSLATALITDDNSGAGARQAQRFALGAPSRIARAVADASGCFRTLDPDPLLLAMPGGVQPDLMLRVRLDRLESPALSFANRAERTVKTRYFGAKPVIDRAERAEISLELVCVREKRIAAEFAGAAEGELHSPPLLQEKMEAEGRENRERVAQAYARAQTAALLFLRASQKLCE